MRARCVKHGARMLIRLSLRDSRHKAQGFKVQHFEGETIESRLLSQRDYSIKTLLGRQRALKCTTSPLAIQKCEVGHDDCNRPWLVPSDHCIDPSAIQNHSFGIKSISPNRSSPSHSTVQAWSCSATTTPFRLIPST